MSEGDEGVWRVRVFGLCSSFFFLSLDEEEEGRWRL